MESFIIRRVFGRKKLSRKSAPKLAVIEVKGVKILNTGFVTLKKHFLALRRTASFDVFCVKNRCARLGGSLSQEPRPPKK